jgi:hypothetical protein
MIFKQIVTINVYSTLSLVMCKKKIQSNEKKKYNKQINNLAKMKLIIWIDPCTMMSW